MTNRQIKTGRWIVGSILSLILGLTVFGAVARLLLGFDLSYAVRLTLTFFLCWMVFRGFFWARVMLSLLLVWTAFQLFIVTPELSGMLRMGWLVIGLLYLASALSLVALPQVRSYFRYSQQP
ncbi:hypothetical protein [Deinococcus puniceus]|uniref:Uncharacterized protein n=1 Tax=Deinococcus puniceus TaxID=1182568 RepID=A0A172TAM4_9DEIO|nr:hypothetical protein [Deinococcus puniceus]ANE44070.1 hypothetical protein SU48_10115 [Deinococcus puniceus]